MLSDQTIDLLNGLSLAEVMRNKGYSVDHQTSTCIFYRCPFHQETSGSFSVDKFPKNGQKYAGFNCYSCGKSNDSKGFGAIMLQQKLMELHGEKVDFPQVTNQLAKDFNLVIEGDYKNGFFHRMKRVDPQEEISFNLKEFPLNNAELRALGCQSVPIFRRSRSDNGETIETAARDDQGEVIYKYSFGNGFYSSYGNGNNFDSHLLQKMFNLYSVDSYTTPERADKDGVLNSYQVSATDSYPIFLFKYQDEKGWWARKYEPYFRETTGKDGRKGANHKFTWWYEGDRRRDDLRGQLYGDADVMRALKTGEVSSSDGEGHPVTEVSRKVDAKRKDVKVFQRIVICSGPRDAINVYFHSNAHVVFPHSESVELSKATIDSLFKIAANVYVLYDIDKTGIRQMHNLALKYVEVKVVYLPEDLATQHNPRTGKACKDAEEFFNFYPAMMRRNEKLAGISVNHYFNDLLITSKRMRFWDIQYQSKKDEDEERFTIKKYTLNFDNMAQFLSANGFYKYTDEARNTKFVRIQNNIVDVVDESQALSVAKEIMKDFLKYNSNYYNEDLSNAISTQKRVGRDTMSNIKEIKLDFMSWGKDFEYFFFRNCSVKVTKDSIEMVDYINLPFHVNREAIIDYDYRPEHTPLFHIKENPDYRFEVKRHEERMADRRMTEEDIAKENANFIAYERLNRFKLSFTIDLKEMAPSVQYLFDTCRIHWEKEQLGLALTPDEIQRQNMHFVNKVALLGYILSRYRTGAMQQMGGMTDYKVVDEGKSSGGTGKSLMRDLFELVRKVCYIPGQSFKRKENMGKNFQEFRNTVHSLCFIDDLREETVGEDFYNSTENLTVKTLYNDEYTLPKAITPKIFTTFNKMSFDLSVPSTARRLFLGMASDYYHPCNYSGTISESSPFTKFGKDIIKEATDSEHNQSVFLMLQCCQFYLGLQESLIPPMEKDGMMRILQSSIRDASFIEWANLYFNNPWHFCRPLAIQDIVINYLEYRGEEVTTISIRKNYEDVMSKMNLYCKNMNYVMNPPIVYRADNGSKYPRHNAWKTIMVNDRPSNRPRERTHTRCCLFYRMGDVPKSQKEILPCPDTDVEKEEERDYNT